MDMGQGDCTVITEPFLKSVVMIDCGQNTYRDNVESIYIPFLQSIGVQKLDALILSHADFDHAGGREAMEEAIQIDAVITDGNETVPVDYSFVHLLPDREFDDENEGSLLSYFSYDGFTYLWPGDAGEGTEQLLMNTYASLDVTVLKAGHHGSAGSSTYDFMDWIRPDLCLISVGKNNTYGHPSWRVLDDLASLNIARFTTAEHGMLHLFSWKGHLFFQTACGYITKLA